MSKKIYTITNDQYPSAEPSEPQTGNGATTYGNGV